MNSVTCNTSNPVTIIKRYWQEPADDPADKCDLPFLIIGHSQLHFQSLIPNTGVRDTKEVCFPIQMFAHHVKGLMLGDPQVGSSVAFSNACEYSDT